MSILKGSWHFWLGTYYGLSLLPLYFSICYLQHKLHDYCSDRKILFIFSLFISFMASLCNTKVHIAWCISILPSKLQSKSKLQEWRGKEEWWCNGAWEWFVRISVLFAIVIRRKKNCTREELTTRTNWAWISPFFSSHLVASYQSSAAELCLATISAHSELKLLILFMWCVFKKSISFHWYFGNKICIGKSV